MSKAEKIALDDKIKTCRNPYTLQDLCEELGLHTTEVWRTPGKVRSQLRKIVRELPEHDAEPDAL